MNVEVSTSVVRWFCGWLFTLGTLLFRWGCSTERKSEWPACFTWLLLAIFVISPLCSRMTLVVKSDAWAIWAKPCLLHLIVFPFFDCFAVLLYTKPHFDDRQSLERARHELKNIFATSSSSKLLSLTQNLVGYWQKATASHHSIFHRL